MSALTGGLAFPVGVAVGHAGDIFTSDDFSGGMSLRDYFAARVFGVAHLTLGANDAGWLGVARLAYEMADAMLKAREL